MELIGKLYELDELFAVVMCDLSEGDFLEFESQILDQGPAFSLTIYEDGMAAAITLKTTKAREVAARILNYCDQIEEAFRAGE